MVMFLIIYGLCLYVHVKSVSVFMSKAELDPRSGAINDEKCQYYQVKLGSEKAVKVMTRKMVVLLKREGHGLMKNFSKPVNTI